MSRVLIIGLMTEGTTDVRFLKSVVTRTFENLLFACTDTVEIYDIQHILPEGDNFSDKVVNAAIKAEENGISVLCVHSDADDRTDDHAIEFRFEPAFKKIGQSTVDLCKFIIPVIPVQMTESWMLADISLLKEEIMSEKTDYDLGLSRAPELISDPKQTIKDAINIAQQEIAKRRKRYELSISDIYLPIGQKINLSRLETLESYIKFKNGVQSFLKFSGYLK
jgi:hypothetical protein